MKSFTLSAHVLKGLILIFCLIYTSILSASGGYYHENRGLYGKENPDFPLNDYVDGKLGVISPKYRLSYLIVAYRYLTNHPLSKEEQQNVLDGINRHVTFEPDVTVDANESRQKSSEEFYSYDTQDDEKTETIWWEASKKHPVNERIQFILSNYPKKMHPFTKYKFALIRLKSVAAELEAAKLPIEKKEAILQAWLNIQDKLFSNELDGDRTLELIKEIPTENLSLIKSDLDYMLAVSYFNSDQEQSQRKASELFSQLAKNEHYPWHEWAAYLSYRTMNRMARPEIGSIAVEKEEQLLTTALAGMQALAITAKDPAVKEAATDYKDIIKSRVDRQGLVLELINTMTDKITKSNFHNMVYFNNVDGATSYIQEGYSPTMTWREMTEDESEILFWIYNYRSGDNQKTFPIAYEHWQKSRNAAWLIVALNAISEANPAQKKELFEAAYKTPPEHPGFFSIRWNLINAIESLEGDTHQSKSKRRKLIADTFKQLKAGNDFSTHEHFAKMGIPLATSLQNLLDYGFFVPSASMLEIYPPIYETDHSYYSPIELSETLNYLPLSVLTQFIQSKQLPVLPKQELYASVWARATLLGKYNIADRIAKKTGELNPHLKPYVDRSLKTRNPQQRIEILVRALLYLPELTPIIHLKSTWLPQFDNVPIYNELKPRKISSSHSTTYWCDAGEINRRVFDSDPVSTFSKLPRVSMLTLTQQKELNKEQTLLNSLPNGTVWLLDKTYKMAKKYPHDKEIPELLALAINLTRVIDCYTSDSKEARKAFYVLKTHYPSSDGAFRTEHHY